MNLPKKIRSITYPGYTDTLLWVDQGDVFMAEVDADWRVWTVVSTGRTVVRNKGWLRSDEFPTLEQALAMLDYRVDA